MKRKWIRVAAAAAVVTSTGPQALAQYRPYAAYRVAQAPVATAPSAATHQQGPGGQSPFSQAKMGTDPGQGQAYQPYRPQVTATGPAGMPTSAVGQTAYGAAVAPSGAVSATQARAAAYPQVASHYPQTTSAAGYPQSAQAAAYPQTAVRPSAQGAAAYPHGAAAAYPSTSYPRVATNYPQVAPAGGQASGPYSASAYSPANYPQTAAVSPTYPSTSTSPASGRYSDYPNYSTVAQSDTLPPPDNSGPLPLPGEDEEPTNGGQNGDANGYNGEATNGANGEPTNGAGGAMPADGYNGYSTGGANGTNGYVPAGGASGMHGYPTTSYPTPDAGCAPAGYGASGDCNTGYPDYGLSGYFDNPVHNSQWFGGVYWLFMTRDDADYQRLTAQFDTPVGGYPYYPTAERSVLSTSHGDHDYRNGLEVRFGSTFATGGHDDCHSSCGTPYGYGYGCDSGCGSASCDMQEYAWEFGYWIIDDDVNVAEAIDSIPTDTNRMYGMKNFAGLEYNGRDVNDYYDYQMPVTDPTDPGATDVRILAQRVRSNFRAQNLELNFLRLPICGVATCGAGGDACGGYGAACAPACGSPFSMTTLCGVRYLRLDDDFEYATMWGIDAGGVVTPPAYTPWDGANELFYDIKVDNELVGFQLGANMTYCLTGNCSVFWNSNFGIYNNHIDVYQRVYGEAGPATYIQSGEEMTINADKDDVAFLGELLIGGSYAFNCNWRGVVAYRAIGITGVALSVDQMPENFSTYEHTALVDANGSIIIHGVQVGVECRY